MFLADLYDLQNSFKYELGIYIYYTIQSKRCVII